MLEDMLKAVRVYNKKFHTPGGHFTMYDDGSGAFYEDYEQNKKVFSVSTGFGDTFMKHIKEAIGHRILQEEE